MKKTKFMLISRKRVQQDINLTINGSPIQQVSSFTYLGVTLSQDLSWGLHIDKVCLMGTCTGVLGWPTLDASPTCLKLWCFPCCRTAQQSGTHTSMGGQLNWRGCKGLRLDWWTEDCAVLCQELGWCPLESRRKLQRILLCCRIITGKSILPCSVFSRSVCARASRHVMNSVQLKTPFVRANYIKGSFFVNTTKL